MSSHLFQELLYTYLKIEQISKFYKEIKPVNPTGNQSWIFIGRTYAEAEAPVLWSPDAKNWLLGKASDAGKDWRQEKKGMTEDEMIGWHHQLDGHEFEQALGDGEGKGGLVCCSPWGRKEQTQLSNWIELKILLFTHIVPIYLLFYILVLRNVYFLSASVGKMNNVHMCM